MLSFEEWIKLPSDKDRSERYKDLSDKDKFKVRQGFYYFGDKQGSLETPLEFDIPNFLKELEDVSAQKK